jgi:hypothetical protein
MMDLIPYGEAHFYRANLIDVKVIMPIMCVSVVEFLYQVVTRQILILKYLLSGTHGSCGHVLSCQALNVAASRGHGSCGALPGIESHWHAVARSQACAELGG